ncbi:hypothetical protein ACIQ57_23730 [Lysinibacillus xylanilyticus]|uniref:hypothetical protein n=1 Tax=Lysinibacillus xylanilyticus TaxID=582475 RepID=UPI0038082C90
MSGLREGKLKIKAPTLMKIATTSKELICLFFLTLSLLYMILRITMFVLTNTFDFVIYSKTLESNLWDLAWSTDIIMGFICFFASSLYFKNRILSFSIFLMTMFSMSIWVFMMLGSKSLIPISDPSLKGNYATHQYLYPEYHDTVVLAITVYKESYPLLYKAANSTTESVSDDDTETITLFNKADYKISDDGKTLSYGKLKISLE